MMMIFLVGDVDEIILLKTYEIVLCFPLPIALNLT
jgi:hypothetical protein